MRIQVKDFMTSPVQTTIGEKKIGEIRNLMKSNGIHALPVIKYTKKLPEAEVTIRGVITATDLSEQNDDSLFVEDVMTQKLYVIHKNTSAKSAAKMMIKKKVHHLIVMDEGKIIGMISSLDFVKLVSEHSLD